MYVLFKNVQHALKSICLEKTILTVNINIVKVNKGNVPLLSFFISLLLFLTLDILLSIVTILRPV